ncbi:unnamed protein product [Urochloa decumbens]|uniref:Uncharacterized protein n=1 Tax=Urochloa decumbens TaxID=240449 RepID=A0ABC9ALP2_9POAL
MSVDDVMDTRMGAILLLENQIPWVVLQALMELGNLDHNKVVVKFLGRMATVFPVGRLASTKQPASARRWCHWWRCTSREEEAKYVEAVEEQLKNQGPRHLLGVFHRHQVGKDPAPKAYFLSIGTSVVELAQIGVKLAASKTKKFGDMEMKKRSWPLGLFGKLSLAPVNLTELTASWLLNLGAYEVLLSAIKDDDFAVSSYVFLLAQLIRGEEDVKDLQARHIISSAMSNADTLHFFRSIAPRLQVGDRYVQIMERIHEYKQDRWIWISIHRFLRDNTKIIIALLSVVGVLAGLFKTILSLKQPQR